MANHPKGCTKKPTQFYFTMVNDSTGEITESRRGQSSTAKAIKEATRWAKDNWSRGQRIRVTVGTRPVELDGVRAYRDSSLIWRPVEF